MPKHIGAIATRTDRLSTDGFLRDDIARAIRLHENISKWVITREPIDWDLVSQEITRRMEVNISTLLEDTAAASPYPTKRGRRGRNTFLMGPAIYATVYGNSDRDREYVSPHILDMLATYSPHAYTSTPGAIYVTSAWLSAVTGVPFMIYDKPSVPTIYRETTRALLDGGTNREAAGALYSGCINYLIGWRPTVTQDIVANPHVYFASLGLIDIDARIVPSEKLMLGPLTAEDDHLLLCALLAYRQRDPVFATVLSVAIIRQQEIPIMTTVPVTPATLLVNTLSQAIGKLGTRSPEAEVQIVTDAGIETRYVRRTSARGVGRMFAEIRGASGDAAVSVAENAGYLVQAALDLLDTPESEPRLSRLHALLEMCLGDERDARFPFLRAPAAKAVDPAAGVGRPGPAAESDSEDRAELPPPAPPPAPLPPPETEDQARRRKRVDDLRGADNEALRKEITKHDNKIDEDIEAVLRPLYTHLEELDAWPGRGLPPQDEVDLSVIHSKLALHDQLVAAARESARSYRLPHETQVRLLTAISVADRYREWLEQIATSETYL